ncbi:MAG: hypothetical protein KTR31_01850 [Myxococcales bacterium]|nr:hypothetical protein [Myxococcales bacterium]
MARWLWVSEPLMMHWLLLAACTNQVDTSVVPGEQTGAAGPYFPLDSPWTTPVHDAAVDPGSEAMIAALQQLGWGLGRFQMDFSLEVLEASASTPRRAFEPTADHFLPDCDLQEVPLPEGGNLEGEQDYRCTTDGDCHLLVADRDAGVLFEMWRADVRPASFRGGCLAVWDLTRTYPVEGRGDQCTSADAAGYPIAPLLFTADEVAAGEIGHALRFALPNSHIDNDRYVRPATHASGAGADGPIPYGVRLRLRSDFDLGRIADPEAHVIVAALQRYGMFLADGGNVALMGRSDQRTEAKWTDLFAQQLTRALEGIEPRDFDVVQVGDSVPLTFACERNGL